MTPTRPAAQLSDLPGRALMARTGAHGPLMLMYHSVSPPRTGRRPDWPWAVRHDQFCRQLDALAETGWRTVTQATLAASPASDSGAHKQLVITFDDGYVDNLWAVDALVERGMVASFFIVSGAIGRRPHWDDPGRPDGRMLDATELRRLHGQGMEIGGHTVDHARLTELPAHAAAAQMRDCRHALEGTLGVPVTSFAYPYGAWTPALATAAGQAGYRSACTTRPGVARRDGNPLTLRRLTVYNHDSVTTLATKMLLLDNSGTPAAVARYAWRRLRSRLPVLSMPVERRP